MVNLDGSSGLLCARNIFEKGRVSERISASEEAGSGKIIIIIIDFIPVFI